MLWIGCILLKTLHDTANRTRPSLAYLWVNWSLHVNPLGKDKSWFFTDPDHDDLENTLKQEEEERGAAVSLAGGRHL